MMSVNQSDRRDGDADTTKKGLHSYSSNSSDKLIYILEYVAQQADPVRLQDIAVAMSMSQSTVLRYINSLLDLGYVYKDTETLRYLPTYKICKLSHTILSQISLRDLVFPDLRTLTRKFGCGATLSRVEAEELLYLDVMYHPNVPVGTVQRIGKSAPMHVTGSGKLFLSSLSGESLNRYLDSHTLTKLTKKSICSVDDFRAELATVSKNGYAIDDEECEDNIRCVSAPLHDYTGHFVAAISLFATVNFFTMEKIKTEILPLLLDTAKTISFKLGYEY